MLKSLVKNGGYELIAFFLIAAINLAILPFLLSYFGSEGYGVISTGVLILFTLGLSNLGVINGFIHVSHDVCQDSKRLQKEVFLIVVLLLLIVSVPVLMVYQMFSDFWLDIVDSNLSIEQRKVINLYVYLLPIHLLKGLIESLYRVRLDGRNTSVFGAIYSLNIVFAFVITSALKLDLIEFTSIRIWYLVLLVLIILFREFVGLIGHALSLNPARILKRLFNFAVWDIANQVNNTLINSVSGLVFIRFFGVSNFYILDIPKRFLEAVNVISVKSSLYLFPLLRTMGVGERRAEFDQVKSILLLTRIVLFFGLVVAFDFLYLANEDYSILQGRIPKYITTFYFGVAIFQPLCSYWYGMNKPKYTAVFGGTVVSLLAAATLYAADLDIDGFLFWFYFVPGLGLAIVYFIFFDRRNVLGLLTLMAAVALTLANASMVLCALLVCLLIVMYRTYMKES